MPDPSANTGGHHLHLIETPDTETEALCIWMLGEFRISIGSNTIKHHEWKLRKAANLFKLLALQPGHRMHREQIMELMWPGFEPQKAANNLYRTLHEARKTLESSAQDPAYLLLQDEHLTLCPYTELWTDVDAFRSAAAVARNTRELKAYRRAIDSYSGELLPDERYEDWAEDIRGELSGLYLDLQIELATLYEKRDEYQPSIEALGEVVDKEPSHEEAHASLMRLYALSGRRREALEQYERLRVALLELETLPGTESERLFEQIQAGDFPPAGGSPVRPSPSEVPHPNNLPTPRTSFIGREREISDLKCLLETTRLLTLTGVGGSGKTRLSLELARDPGDDHPDGVWLVELASVSDPALVPQAVARALGVREHPNRPLTGMIVDSLRSAKTLLVLDNCEHVIEAVARLVEELLEGCPYLQVLATSREVTGAGGEMSWPVPTLSVSDTDNLPTVEELEQYEGVQLFVDRARLRIQDFTLTEHNTAAVARMCHKLDGIPLTIELAAARVGVLGVEQISERLEDSLRLLSAGPRTAEPRQQTLRGALDWSHELLHAREQQLFRWLAVFAGGFTLEAVETVASKEDVGGGEVLDLLSNLIDKSLLVVTEQRYRLLEPVRQYARQKLEESGEAQELRRRHLLWCVEFAERAEPELTKADQAWWQARLEAEHDNIRAALRRAFESGEPESGLRLSAALWMFWYTHGYLGEGRRWLEKGLAEAVSGPPQARASALMGSGWLAVFQKKYASAEKSLQQSLALYRELDDKEGIVSCLTKLVLGAVLGERNLESIPVHMGEVMRLQPELEDGRTKADALIVSGMAFISRHDVQNAVASYDAALEISRRIGDEQSTSISLFNLGFITLGGEDLDRATSLFRESLQLSQGSGHRLVFMYTVYGLAGIAATRGRPARAARLWGAVETVCKATGLGLDAMTTSRHEHRLDRARSELGRKAFDSEREIGKAMTREETVTYALSEELLPLTPREIEVTELVAQDFTNRQISEELTLSERTVHSHLRNIFRKLGASSRAEVAERLEQNNP
ncbi:BTAD domain-containing putative transcriptional regulator [soil metagenome]